MAEDITIVSARNAGVKDNVHGGQLTKWYLVVRKADGTTVADVYSQRKPENDFAPEQTVYGRIEDGDYGPRLYLEQREDGTPGAPSAREGAPNDFQLRPGTPMSKDDYWTARNERDIVAQARMGRAHAQEMSIRAHELLGIKDRPIKDSLIEMADFFQEDVLRFPLDSDVGGGGSQPQRTPVAGAETQGVAVSVEPTADVSAEASPQLKGKLTQALNKAGVAKNAQKAIVYFRSRGDTTAEAVRMLLKDLSEGATAEHLFAEIGDAAGSDLYAAEALKLLPPNAPLTETLDYTGDEGKDGDDVPF